MGDDFCEGHVTRSVSSSHKRGNSLSAMPGRTSADEAVLSLGALGLCPHAGRLCAHTCFADRNVLPHNLVQILSRDDVVHCERLGERSTTRGR